MKGSLGYALVSWAVLAGCYLILAGKTAGAEIALALLVGAIAAALLVVVRANSTRHFQIKLASLGKLRRVPAQMARDCAVVYGAILRQPFQRRSSGRFQERNFHRGNEHPAARGRRALVILGISAAPNSYALGVTPNDKLLVHQLVPEAPLEREPDWPL